MRVLLLGGTSEASALARAFAAEAIPAVFSYAGRTDAPVAQPLPVRIGGFGGVQGLCDFLLAEKITHLVDATHPFAGQMTGNAVAACRQAGLPYLALERPPWQASPGDRWTRVGDVTAAVAALPDKASRVFLAIGRQNLAPFAAKPQHHYLLRLVDPAQDLPLPDVAIILARGPFDVAGDIAVLRCHRIEWIIAKNAGGEGAAAKLAAARALSVPVIMIDRPASPARATVADVADVLHWLHHGADRRV